jgi:two-component system phosphate regulon sensor histidine kinase PhoR
VVRDAAAALQGLAQLDDVKICVTGLDGLPLLIGDRDELIQLFQNLIHNAIKYGRKGGNIRVLFSLAPGAAASPGRHSAGSFVAIAVKDDGDGIPREAIPRLTERFYRVDVKKSRERGGTGLGLAIVKHIVNRHHGKLLIDSKAGEGSTFTVLLPVVAGADNAAITLPGLAPGNAGNGASTGPAGNPPSASLIFPPANAPASPVASPPGVTEVL